MPRVPEPNSLFALRHSPHPKESVSICEICGSSRAPAFRPLGPSAFLASWRLPFRRVANLGWQPSKIAKPGARAQRPRNRSSAPPAQGCQPGGARLAMLATFIHRPDSRLIRRFSGGLRPTRGSAATFGRGPRPRRASLRGFVVRRGGWLRRCSSQLRVALAHKLPAAGAAGGELLDCLLQVHPLDVRQCHQPGQYVGELPRQVGLVAGLGDRTGQLADLLGEPQERLGRPRPFIGALRASASAPSAAGTRPRSLAAS